MLTPVIAVNNKSQGVVTDIPCQISVLFISNFILDSVRNFILHVTVALVGSSVRGDQSSLVRPSSEVHVAHTTSVNWDVKATGKNTEAQWGGS